MSDPTEEIKIACPHCGQHLVIDSSMLGAELECPVCGNVFKEQKPATVPPLTDTDGSNIAPPMPERTELKPASAVGVNGVNKRRNRCFISKRIYAIAMAVLVLIVAGFVLSQDNQGIPSGMIKIQIPDTVFRANVVDGKSVYEIPWEDECSAVSFQIQFKPSLLVWQFWLENPSRADNAHVTVLGEDGAADRKWRFLLHTGSAVSVEDMRDSKGSPFTPPQSDTNAKWHTVTIVARENETAFIVDGKKTVHPPLRGEKRFDELSMLNPSDGAQIKDLAIYTTKKHQTAVALFREGLSKRNTDMQASLQLAEEAAASGLSDAQSWLGITYYGGLVEGKGKIEAFPFLLAAAKQGNVNSECLVGQMYLLGEGVNKNGAEANRWLTEAAKGGNLRAQYLLGGQLFHGIGVETDLVQAKQWLEECNSTIVAWQEKRDDLGSIDDISNVYFMLSQIYVLGGDGIETDIKLGVKYLKVAADLGNEEAKQMVKTLQ